MLMPAGALLSANVTALVLVIVTVNDSGVPAVPITLAGDTTGAATTGAVSNAASRLPTLGVPMPLGWS